MLLLSVVAEHDVEPILLRMPPQADRLRWRVLPIIVKVDEIRTARVSPTGQHGVVFTEVTGMLDQRDRHVWVRVPHEVAAHRASVVAAAIVYQDDLVSAFDREPLDVFDQAANRRGASVQRND